MGSQTPALSRRKEGGRSLFSISSLWCLNVATHNATNPDAGKREVQWAQKRSSRHMVALERKIQKVIGQPTLPAALPRLSTESSTTLWFP